MRQVEQISKPVELAHLRQEVLGQMMQEAQGPTRQAEQISTLEELGHLKLVEPGRQTTLVVH
jgi:hypothetical protein